MLYSDFFALRLAKLRTAKKVSAREMSLDLGQNESYINRIENKKTFPSMQIFFYICDYLQITPKEFFDDELVNPNQIETLTNHLKDLSPRQLDLLGEIICEFSKKK